MCGERFRLFSPGRGAPFVLAGFAVPVTVSAAQDVAGPTLMFLFFTFAGPFPSVAYQHVLSVFLLKEKSVSFSL